MPKYLSELYQLNQRHESYFTIDSAPDDEEQNGHIQSAKFGSFQIFFSSLAIAGRNLYFKNKDCASFKITKIILDYLSFTI